MDLELLRSLVVPAESKILLLVMDGLGGAPRAPGGPTELEAARTPNLDALAARAVCGMLEIVGPGITPGSGPGHLALFGYDPLVYRIGRGVLEALGIGMELAPVDVAARGNFCTVDRSGRIADRRAGRIPTSVCEELAARLDGIQVPGASCIVRPVREHRFVVVFRGEGLGDALSETDPQRVGAEPLPVRALAPAAEPAARAVNAFVAEARRRLQGQPAANMVLLRGFASHPSLPTFKELYGLTSGAIAVYPMYRGLARLAGMAPLPTGSSVAEEFEALAAHWAAYDFLYLHVKGTDTTGEDGNFDAKVAAIEEVDAQVPRALGLTPDVIVVTGDHSTPSALKAHSWHPVPFLLCARNCRPDAVQHFGERACIAGQYGRLRGPDLLPLVLANAERLTKYGA
jgi:2,3-bisphosphoglycerate-independent phosphoglycerate mutase